MKPQPNNDYQLRPLAIYNRIMKQAFDHFILAIPVLFIKQFPYAWIAAVVLWSWPPFFSGIFLSIIVIGLLMLRWQSSAWISNLQREHAFKDGKFHVDQPSFSFMDSARKILILMAGAALLAWLLFERKIWLKFLAGLSDDRWVYAPLSGRTILRGTNNLRHHRPGDWGPFHSRSH